MNTKDHRYDELRCGVRVDLDAIRYNLLSMKALAPGKLIMSVVKADAYGHGSVRTSQFIEDISDSFAVATVDEGLKLRQKAHILKPILILGPVSPSLDRAVIDNDLTETIFDFERAFKLNESALASREGKKAHVHVAVDTGMSRIGLLPDEVGLKTLKKICGLSGIKVDGIFTHFATADMKDKTEALKAYGKFTKFKKLCKDAGIDIPLWHAANSASIIEGIALDRKMDMVRCGISMYGIYPSNEVHKEKLILKPTMEWYSFVTRVIDIGPGTSVSYGYTFTADKAMKIATISAGYADGYPRLLSNMGEVLIRGKRVRIVGRICMDQFMADVSDVPCVKAGDKIILMGTDKKESITADEIADKCGTIPYEIICGISGRVPRVYGESLCKKC